MGRRKDTGRRPGLSCFFWERVYLGQRLVKVVKMQLSRRVSSLLLCNSSLKVFQEGLVCLKRDPSLQPILSELRLSINQKNEVDIICTCFSFLSNRYGTEIR